MKKLTVVTIFVLAGFLNTGCHHHKGDTRGRVDTEIQSYADVGVKNKKYTNVVISAPVEDLILRGFLEDALVTELLRYNVVAIQFTKLFPPTRQYSENEIKDVISDYDFATNRRARESNAPARSPR